MGLIKLITLASTNEVLPNGRFTFLNHKNGKNSVSEEFIIKLF